MFSATPKWQPPPIASPCTKVCTMDQTTGFCKGCFRTIEEIAYWSTMGISAREKVMIALEARKRAAASNPPASSG
jgi:hypothetical protein